MKKQPESLFIAHAINPYDLTYRMNSESAVFRSHLECQNGLSLTRSACFSKQKLTNYTRRARAQPKSKNVQKNSSGATFWLGTPVRFPGLPWALLASLWVHLGKRSELRLGVVSVGVSVGVSAIDDRCD